VLSGPVADAGHLRSLLPLITLAAHVIELVTQHLVQLLES
jgi:hypothetical protein